MNSNSLKPTITVMQTHKELEDYILAKPGATQGYPFGAEVAVYKVHDKMFALIPEKKDPLNISLKCDPILAETLREKYETVLPGYHLSKKHWNTIVCSGQLSTQEIFDLIDHSYQLVVSGLPKSVRTSSALSSSGSNR